MPRVPMLLVVIQREQLRGQGTSATATPSMIDCDLPGKPLGTSAFTPHAPHLFNQIERKKKTKLAEQYSCILQLDVSKEAASCLLVHYCY